MVIERDNDTPVIKGFVGKIGKRGIVIACAVVLIGAAVFANWMLFSKDKDGFDGYDQSSDLAGSLNTGNNASSADDADDYFATMQVSRKRSRDEALEVLQSVVDNSDADEAVRTQALGDINRLALEMTMESNIETLVMGKGFADCVAVLSGDSATVVVKTDGKGLMANQIAQINEIVYEQAKILPVNIKITER